VPAPGAQLRATVDCGLVKIRNSGLGQTVTPNGHAVAELARGGPKGGEQPLSFIPGGLAAETRSRRTTQIGRLIANTITR